MNDTETMSAAARRDRNLARLGEYFRHLSALDIASWIELWAPDCVQVMPFATGGIPGSVHGREAVHGLYRGMADSYAELHFDDLELLPLVGTEKILARWRPRGLLTDGRVYRNENVALFEFDSQGRIEKFTEYFNPVVAAAAFPGDES